MLALRYAAVLALVFWIGGLVVLGGIAAPTAFEVLGPRAPDGRALAGALFGETLRRFHTVAYVCGAVLVLSLAVRAVLGPRPRQFPLRLMLSVVMTGAALWTGFVLIPQIAEAQLTSGPSLTTLSDDDPRRAAFGQLHGLSTALQLVPVLGGLTLLVFELRD